VARGRTAKVLVRRIDTTNPGDSGGTATPDELAVEEPLEIRLDDHLVATTMRTPGNDFELAVGWCHGEGLLAGAPVTAVRYCATGSALDTEYNVVTVETGGVAPAPSPDAQRLTTATTSCGLCGSTTIATLTERLAPVARTTRWDPGVLAAVPDRVRDAQRLFATTGGVHAAAAFDVEGNVTLVREDIGRHNAVDKVAGRLLLDHALPATGRALFVSGRASFELVAKAWAAGFETMLAVSAPSSLAVATAREAGIDLYGFVRGGAMNAYVINASSLG
jgi:FdhD protein